MSKKNMMKKSKQNKEQIYFNIFKSSDLLSYEQLKQVKLSVFPNEKAIIVGDALLKYCFITDGVLYTMNKYSVYEKMRTKSMQESKIKTLATQMLQASYENLSSEAQDAIKGEDSKAFVNMINQRGISQYYDQLTSHLCNDFIELDRNTEWQLHFLNGYLDLKENEFKKREIGKHYITHCIKRNYKESSKDKRNEIMKIFKMTYPNEKDRNYVLSHFGRALSGMSEIDQVNLFLLGDGSTSKSFIMKLIQASIETYLVELSSTTFEAGNPKIDKILNTFDDMPSVRIAWVNELSDKRMDDSLFKTFCEGKVKTCKLYKEGNHDIILQCKLILTSNDLPAIKIDSGSKRRIRSYTHKSKFVDDPKAVDPSKHIYLKDKNLLERIRKDDELLNAVVDILVEHCSNWRDNKEPEEPESVKEAKDMIVNSNDIIQDFIDKNLEITDNHDDRIGKNEMRDLFVKMYPNKHLSVLQLISSLKQKGINYSPKYRVDGIQGCYYSVKLTEEPESKAVIYDKTEEKLTKALKKANKLIEDKDAEIEQLKERLKELEAKSKSDIKKVIKSEEPVKKMKKIFKDATKKDEEEIEDKPKQKLPKRNDYESIAKLVFG